MSNEYVCIGTDPKVNGELMKAFHAIKGRHLSLDTLATWTLVPAYLKEDDGLVLLSEDKLMATLSITQLRASRALKELAEIGAFIELGDGRYRAHPELIWNGDLGKREEAAAKAPPLALGKRPKLSVVEA